MRIRALTTALTIALVWSAAAQAKTFEVTRAGDPGPGPCKPRDCSLREAILAANARPGADKIVLPAKRYKLTRGNPGDLPEDVGTFGDLDVNNDPLSITHPGRGRARINARGLDRVFDVQAGAATSLRKLVITGGVVSGSGGGILSDANLRLKASVVAGNESEESIGGGIDVNGSAALTVIGSQIRGNRSGNSGGAIHGSDGGAVSLVRSTVSGNEAMSAGGALRLSGSGPVSILRTVIAGNQAEFDGGAIYSTMQAESITLRRSTIRGNRTGADGGALRSAGGALIRVIASTLNGNSAAEDGGALSIVPGQLEVSRSTFSGNRSQLDGGAIFSTSSNAAIVNSTFSGNRAAADGGAISNGGNLAVNATTVARNVSNSDNDPGGGAGGGIFNLGGGVEIGNSILALNDQLGGDADDCAGIFASAGGNLRTDGTDCAGFDQPGDVIRTTPKLGQLRRNGGPTKTIELRRGSPAIGRAIESFATDRDQRGRRRDGNPDSGAYERGA